MKVRENEPFMKTYLIVDISGKVLNYDYALSSAMGSISEDTIVLATHVPDKGKYFGNRLWLLNLVPSSYKGSGGKIKRFVKAVEGFVNYNLLLIFSIVKHPAVIHFQWFPFLEFSSIEIPFLRLLRWLMPKTRFVYTIHNVFPHSTSQPSKREKYRKRIMRINKGIDYYIVHTETTAKEIEQLFFIENSRVSVVPHGIFKPDYELHKNNLSSSDGKKTIIFYGVNRRNKGADILLDAIRQLPDEFRKQVRVLIVGRTPNEYLKELQAKVGNAEVEFRPTFIPDNELFEMIESSDFIALPYREISQSGVLLLALYFRKPLLISNLPSFRETLKGFTSDMFFETGDSKSMSELIIRMLSGEVDTQKELKVIESLNEEYSWENSARKTLDVYRKYT